MKKTALGIVVVWPLFVLGQLSSLAAGDCVQKCPPRWRAPSPNLDDACHHQFNGTPFASCTCHRAYTSPHILGYGGMGCCYGYQKPCTICPWHFPGGMRCWAPAYCHDPASAGMTAAPAGNAGPREIPPTGKSPIPVGKAWDTSPTIRLRPRSKAEPPRQRVPHRCWIRSARPCLCRRWAVPAGTISTARILYRDKRQSLDNSHNETIRCERFGLVRR